MFTLVATKFRDPVDNTFHVAVQANGDELDRRYVAGWSVPNEKLAERLVKAIHAGVVLDVNGVLTDVNGKTYLSCTSKVLGRTMNADLKRMGF